MWLAECLVKRGVSVYLKASNNSTKTCTTDHFLKAIFVIYEHEYLSLFHFTPWSVSERCICLYTYLERTLKYEPHFHSHFFRLAEKCNQKTTTKSTSLFPFIRDHLLDVQSWFPHTSACVQSCFGPHWVNLQTRFKREYMKTWVVPHCLWMSL